MVDPSGIYTVDERAVERLLGSGEASGHVLVHALGGFIDAGHAGELAMDHLVSDGPVTRLVTFDVDQLLDYRSKRTSMTFSSDHWSDYAEPYLVLDHVTDAEGTGFLLLHGAEPDLQWERVAAALTGLVERFGVSLVVGLHGIPMGIPHTRPLTVTAHGTRKELLGEHRSWFGTVTVPSSLAALWELRLGERGHDAMGYAVHVPHYLAQSPYPPAAVVALQSVERSTGLELASDRLAEAAREATEEVERQVHESDEVQAVVRALEEQYDSFARQLGTSSLLAESVPLPTAEELGAEFERFLAEQSDES